MQNVSRIAYTVWIVPLSRLAMNFLIAAFAFSIFNPNKVATPPELRIQGTKVMNAKGKEVWLRGVNTACLEWTSDGEGHVVESIRVATQEWKCNVIRLPMSQDRWYGFGPEQSDFGKSYRALVNQCVEEASKNGAYIILDLHWNNANEWGKNIGQHHMPDENSEEFWIDVSRRYANHPAVLFNLYNEPHSISWDVWKNGGMIDEKTGPGARQGPFKPVKYRTPGMQSLVNTIRKNGARNVIVVGGLDWSYDMSGFLNGYTLNDPSGNGILYDCHTYPFKGDTLKQWQDKMLAVEGKIPFMIGEFGQNLPKPGETETMNPAMEWLPGTLNTILSRKYHFAAWDFHVAAGPTLIKDWSYEPTPLFGEKVKQALIKNAGK